MVSTSATKTPDTNNNGGKKDLLVKLVSLLTISGLTWSMTIINYFSRKKVVI